MIDAIAEMLGRCGTSTAVMPPTEVFNEGWMLRLALDWLDRNRAEVRSHPLAFCPGARWYSEALLSSRFLPRTRGDLLAESHTHADGVIGHFDIRSRIRGDAKLLPGAKQFVVTEAKLGSSLSAGTKNAKTYDQAARNVACMAHLLGEAGIAPRSLDRLAFFVIAPRSQIASGVFSKLIIKESIEAKVRQRIAPFGGTHDRWFEAVFVHALERIEVDVLSWESVLEGLPATSETDAIRRFYAECLRFNPLRGAKFPGDIETPA
jgi:hypothetical protein